MQREQWPPVVSKYTQCFKRDHLLNLKGTISKSHSSTMSCSSKKLKKPHVIHRMKGKYQYKRLARFVCVCTDEDQNHNDLVVPQKVEGA